MADGEEPRELENAILKKWVYCAWNGILAKKTSFGYQEGVNSRVVNQWQRKPFYQVMIGQIEWKERVNQKIL